MTRIAALAVALGASLGAHAQSPTFSSRVEQVRVDVLVSENGRPLAGLHADDFDVFDEGVAQHVALVSFDQAPLHITFALDMSDSVRGDRLARLRTASRAVLSGMTTHDEAALVTFSDVVRLESKLTDEPDRISAALDATEGGGNTALIDGTYAGLMAGESDAARSLLIVFSDGVDTASWLSPETVLDAAKRSNSIVYALTPREDRRSSFLRDLTSATAGRLYEVDARSDVRSIFVGILDEFRHRYLLSFTPEGVAPTGWHRLGVRVKGHPKATIFARQGYSAR